MPKHFRVRTRKIYTSVVYCGECNHVTTRQSSVRHSSLPCGRCGRSIAVR